MTTAPLKRCYISGPMLGKPYYNYPSFMASEDAVKGLGYDPVNPARMDMDSGFDCYSLPPDYDWDKLPEGDFMAQARKRDMDAVESSDAIYMLEGWENSLGANAELAFAKWKRLPVYYEVPDVAETVLKYVVPAIRKCMEDGLKKHPRDSWLQEPISNHIGKAGRHLLTHRLIEEGNQKDDGESHLMNAMCRAAMAYAHYRNDLDKKSAISV